MQPRPIHRRPQPDDIRLIHRLRVLIELLDLVARRVAVSLHEDHEGNWQIVYIEEGHNDD